MLLSFAPLVTGLAPLVAPPPPTSLVTRQTHARHDAIVAREINFVADLEVVTEPFEVGTKPVGEWFCEPEALQILMSQAEISKRLDSGASSAPIQRWEVSTPIDFPGMVVRSQTAMDINVDAATPKLSISSAESTTVCEGGPPWAQSLLARIGEIATTESSNVISLRDAPSGKKQAVSKVNLTVKLNIPTLLLPPFIPQGPFERTGSQSLQTLLDRDMGPVLQKFREGYKSWAA